MAMPALAILAALLCTAGTASAAASISVVGSSTFTTTGQWLKVRVKKPAPELGDVVGLFVWNGPYASAAALGQDILAQTAIKYWFPAQANASYLDLNQTTFRIQLPNYRKNLFLAFFGAATYGGNYGGFLLKEFLLAVTPPIVNANPNEIQHVHINVVSTADTTCLVAFQWTTRDWQDPVARYWLQGVDRIPANAKGPFNGSVTAYSRGDMCGAPASTTGWFEPGSLNYVYVSLPLGAIIYYQVGSRLTGTWSQTYFFATPHAPKARKAVNILWSADYGNKAPDKSFQFGSASPSTKFDFPPSAGSLPDITNGYYWFAQNVFMVTGAATSQGGSSLTSTAIERDVRKGNIYHAMFISGDISYARGYQTQWEQFFLQNVYTFARVPLYVALGNHERNWPVGGDRFRYFPRYLDRDSGGECGVPTLKRFINPPPFTPLRNPGGPALPDTPWYSIDIGPIHFLTYSSEHDLFVNSPQWLFVRDDLASVNRTKTPFVVVSGHRPMHVNSIDGVLPTSNLLVGQQTLQAFEDLFYIYEVDLVLHGHHHTYQRTKPVYKRNVTQGAPVYVVAGNAGHEFSPVFQPSNPDYFEKILVRHGFLRIRANYTALRVKLVHAVDDSILDDFTLTKPANYKPSTAARQAFVAARADVSDQYSTKLWTNFSLPDVSNSFGAIREYIDNDVIGTAFLLFSENNNATYVKYLLTNNVNFAPNLTALYVSWDFVVNYVTPVVLNAHPDILDEYPSLLSSIDIVRKSLEFGRSLLAKGAGRR